MPHLSDSLFLLMGQLIPKILATRKSFFENRFFLSSAIFQNREESLEASRAGLPDGMFSNPKSKFG
jgi:hypothetical protein